jgi:hypothetical protein
MERTAGRRTIYGYEHYFPFSARDAPRRPLSLILFSLDSLACDRATLEEDRCRAIRRSAGHTAGIRSAFDLKPRRGQHCAHQERLGPEDHWGRARGLPAALRSAGNRAGWNRILHLQGVVRLGLPTADRLAVASHSFGRGGVCHTWVRIRRRRVDPR